MKQIHITNGECFNKALQAKEVEQCIPFNEAMIEGEPRFPILDNDFIQERCRVHEVSMESYLETLNAFVVFGENMADYDSVVLWFGDDLFCQMNLLTVLAYLEEKAFKGKIYTIIIDDVSKKIIRDKKAVSLGSYITLYKSLFQDNVKGECSDHCLNKAIDDYLNLKDSHNEIASFVKKQCQEMSRQMLFEKVWDMTRQYGLGDTQVRKLIEKYSSF